MKWCVGLWIACLWACNPIDGVKISGDLRHYKGNKLYFEICGQDVYKRQLLLRVDFFFIHSFFLFFHFLRSLFH